MPFRDEVTQALASLGSVSVGGAVDALADPGGARALDEEEAVLLRAAPELEAGSETHGPTPADPVWLRLVRGSRVVTMTSLRGGATQSARVTGVALEATTGSCCDAPGCTAEKRFTRAWLSLEGEGAPGRLLVAEERTTAPAPGTAALAVGARLARYAGVAVEGDDAGADAALPEALGALAAPELARFALRAEGDRVVLRDLAADGPRATAGRNTVIGAVLLAIALGLWVELALAVRAGSTQGAVVFGATGALLTLAAVAFLGVARFAARYQARSAPLVALGRDRLVVLPWVGRSGAVDLRPEGRLGAAIPLGEVRRPAVAARGGRRAVELDTDHGAIDALACEGEAVARYWAGALARVTDEARHPSTATSARQRLRARVKE